MKTAHELLKQYFGFDGFRGEQLDIIEHVLDGGHALVIMPTGGGNRFVFRFRPWRLHRSQTQEVDR